METMPQGKRHGYRPIPVPPELFESVRDAEAIEADFLTPSSVAVLWTNGGRLHRLAQENKPKYLANIIYTEDKKTVDRFRLWGVERLRDQKRYTVRLFCEGYRLKADLVDLLINSGVEVIEC